jgi:hypothetical protein
MSQLSNSSDIRNALDDFEDVESLASEIDESDVGPDSDELLDFSSGSEDFWAPGPQDIDSDTSITDIEALVSDNRRNDRPILTLELPPPPQPQVSHPSRPRPVDANCALPRTVEHVHDNETQNDPSEPFIGPINISANPRWVRVYPPEPEFNVEDKFEVRHTGIRNCPPRNSNPIEYFSLFFTNLIWLLLVRNTNAYARKTINTKRDSGLLGPKSRLTKWVDVTEREIKKYIALVLNMGLIRKKNIEDYWSTSKSQLTPFFSKVMSLNRFQAIRSMFQISSLRFIPKDQPGHDPWYKVRFFLDQMNGAFKKYFTPDQNLSLDESMIGMKNRCVYIKYMPNKRHARFGIKKFEVCDSKTGYILHSELYTGKGFLGDGDEPFTQKVVMFLMRKCGLLGKGYHLFMDNYYTKLPVAEKLFENNTFLTGTVNKKSKDLSKKVLEAELNPLQTIYYRKDKTLLVGYKQKPKRKPVYLITTGCYAKDEIIRSRSGIETLKPTLIHKYNMHMGGVDSKDKSVYHVSCTRQTKKYWKKIFDNLTDMALFNAWILYSKNTDKPLTRHNFIVSIIESLVSEGDGNNVQPNNPMPGPGGDIGHTLTRLPGVKLRLCDVCSASGKKSRSHFFCPGCNCGIHPACFHKLNHFWRPTKKGRRSGSPNGEGQNNDSD